MNARKTLLVAIFFCFPLLGACGGQLYKIAPLPSSRPPEISTNNPNGLSIGAVAFDGDKSIEQFEANLPMAGVIAIDIRLSNLSSEKIDASNLQFELSDGEGAILKPISPKKALGRVMKWNGDRFYTLEARRRTLESYEGLALKTGGEIAPQKERRGVLFFQTKNSSFNFNDLTLSVHGGAAPISLKLGTR